ENSRVRADCDPGISQRERLGLPTARTGLVKLRATGEAAARAAQWEGAKKARGGVEVSLEMAPNEWLVGWILGLGGDVEVLAPAELRTAVRERLRTIAADHA